MRSATTPDATVQVPGTALQNPPHHSFEKLMAAEHQWDRRQRTLGWPATVSKSTWIPTAPTTTPATRSTSGEKHTSR